MEYWTIGIVVTALGLMLYSQINDSIRDYRNFKTSMAQIDAIRETNKKLADVLVKTSETANLYAETNTKIAEQNERIRENNKRLAAQNRQLVETHNALMEENERLHALMEKHGISLEGEQ